MIIALTSAFHALLALLLLRACFYRCSYCFQYKPLKGFRELIQRDWIDFGHKFSDRLGLLNHDANEVSPVFLQWLDCVYQLHHQNINAFQFSTSFLVLFFSEFLMRSAEFALVTR